MNKNGCKNARKIKLNATKWSARNKLLENRHVLIKFWSKKYPVEKVQTSQNATTKGVEKIKRACKVKLREP